MVIKSKAEMYKLYHAGAFGNRLRTWRTLDDLLADPYEGLVVLRYMVPGSPWCAYGLTKAEALDQAEKWGADGARRDLFTVNEFAKDDLIVLQGEVRRSEFFLDLRYTRAPLPMRKALAVDERHAHGLTAVRLLREALDPASYAELWDLFDAYDSDDTVIEFSTWGIDVGDTPHRNTVFWEVRNY